MKLLLVAVFLVAGANAGIFSGIVKEIDSTFKGLQTGIEKTGEAFLPYAKGVGKHILKEAATSGLSFLSTGLTDLISKAFASLFHIGRRDTSFIENLLTFEHHIKNMVNKGVEEFIPVFHSAVDQFEHLANKVSSLDFNLPELEKSIASIVLGHHKQAGQFLKDLEGSVAAIGHSVFGMDHRRGFFDAFSGITDALKGAFLPAFNKLTGFLGNAGTALKSIASNVVSSVTQNVSQLVDKLTPHLTLLKQHATDLLKTGTDALSAMTYAGKDILGQTVANVGGTLSKLG